MSGSGCSGYRVAPRVPVFHEPVRFPCRNGRWLRIQSSGIPLSRIARERLSRRAEATGSGTDLVYDVDPSGRLFGRMRGGVQRPQGRTVQRTTMNARRIFLGMVVAFTLAAQEQAVETDTYFPQRMTARELLLACSSSSLTSTGRQRQRYCYGFASGVEESLRLAEREAGGRRLCVPAHKSARELASAYVKYASRKEIDLDRPAVVVVVQSLDAAFPCTAPLPGR